MCVAFDSVTGILSARSLWVDGTYWHMMVSLVLHGHIYLLQQLTARIYDLVLMSQQISARLV